jgi:hypothetical protein
MTEIHCQKNEQTFLVQFLPASLIGVCWYLPDSSGGGIRNDYNSDGMHNRSKNDHSAWDTFYDTTP